MGQGLSLRCAQYQAPELRQRLSKKMKLSLEQEQAQKQELRLEQIQANEGLFELFLQIMTQVHAHEIQPNALCTKCRQGLSISEIVLGFRPDVDDFTTECPRCKTRFEATNLVDQRTGKEHRFWCRDQTLARLQGKEQLEVDEFKRLHPEIYFSAIFHFGSLYGAFKRIQVVYRREKWDWTTKIKFCLGKISDRDISQIFGVTVRQVAAERGRLKIKPGRGKSIIPANRKISLAT